MHGFELLERARDASAKLLAVERAPVAGSPEAVGAAILLVFDVGRILVVPDAVANVLHLETLEQAPKGMQSSLEEEPWWRVLGCLLTGAAAEDSSRVLRLELRTGPATPRTVTLTLEGESIRSALEGPPG